MSRLFLPLFALIALAGCGDKPDAQQPAKQAATSDAPVATEAELKAKFATEAQQAITKDNANAVADELLKEIAADNQ